jgi:predicted ABC-type ATPase
VPYGISKSQSDCSGWATVKKNSDGSFETVACHDSKQAAIDQMVAVSISEKIEPIGDVSRRSRDDEVVVVDLDETMVTKSRYPIREVVDAVNRLAHRVFIVTGREEAQREQTLDDLEFAGIGYDALFMMPDVDDDIAAYKRATIENLMREFEIVAFVDDNDANRAAVESLGVYVLTPDEFVAAASEAGLFDDDESDDDESDEDESDDDESREQPRRPNGQWGSTGGAGSTGGGKTGKAKPAKTKKEKQPKQPAQPKGYSKAKPGSKKYADDTQEKMQAEQIDAVGTDALKASEKMSIINYTHEGHTNINKAARGAPPPPLTGQKLQKAERMGNEVDGVIKRTPPLTNDIIVHRGTTTSVLGVKSKDDLNGLVGSEFTDKGIVSTSLSLSTAQKHGNRVGDAVIMRVTVPAGSRAYAVPPELEYFNPMDITNSFESEVLLPRGTRFKVTSVGKERGFGVVNVEVVADSTRSLDDELRYDPLQPRAPDGKWTSGGGGFSSGSVNTGESGGGAAGGGSSGGSAGTAAGGAPRPGMGDIPLDSDTVAAMRGGSAEKHLVTMPDGSVQFTPERQALHDKIVRDTVDGVPPSANPTFYMMGGGAAAGKSSMVRSGVVDVPGEGKAVQLNVDETRKRIPEYGAMQATGDKSASAFTHEEASYVTKRAQAAAFERKQDAVLDGTGDSSEASLNKKITTAQANGYEVKGYYATVPVKVAIERSDARGSDPNSPDFGRFVPHAVIEAQHKSVASVLPNSAGKFDSVQLYDTTVFGSPRLLMEGGKGKINIVDQAGYDAFLAIGGGG